MYPDLEQLRETVIRIAREYIPTSYGEVEGHRKADGSLLTEVDLALQRQIDQALTARWPGFAFLGEEMEAEEQTRLLSDTDRGVWCLDPLDGTRNFVAGLPCFSVSLALLVKQEVVLGLVYDPVRNECFSARKGHGTWLNDKPLGQRCPDLPLREGIGLIDFKHLPAILATRLATAPPYSSQRSFGSVALDWCWLAAGRSHVYLHGRQKIWDYAAGSLILSEAGGQAVTLEGHSVFRAELEPRSVAAALDSALFDEWIAWLGIRR